MSVTHKASQNVLSNNNINNNIIICAAKNPMYESYKLPYLISSLRPGNNIPGE